MLNEDAPIEAMLMVFKAGNQKCNSHHATCLTCGYEIFCNKLASTYKTVIGLLTDEEQERLEGISKRMDFIIK